MMRTAGSTAGLLTALVAAAAVVTPGAAGATTTSQVSCTDAYGATIEVYPPGKNPDGSIVGVARYHGDGSQYTAYTQQDVPFGVDREVGRASGAKNGESVYVPANVTEQGKYYTAVIYDGNEWCQSQSVSLP